MTKKLFSFIFLFVDYTSIHAQMDKDALLTLPAATTAELNAIASPNLGSLAFDTDKDQTVQYTSDGWKPLLNSGVYSGSFIISNDGNQTITGIPFKPRTVIFKANANIEVTNLNSDNGLGNNNQTLNNSFGSMDGFARDDNGTITQQVIYIGGSGHSINDISRYASTTNCIGLRYSSQNGDNLGIISASLGSFNADGFTINIDKTLTATTENIVVLYTAYN